MALLVRKISPNKWKVDNYPNYDTCDVRADAISELKTSSNDLSTWEISDSAKIEEAVLALVTNLDKLEKMDIVVIDEDIITAKNITVASTPGSTPVVDLINTHKDITNLNYKLLGDIARIIIDSLNSEQHHFFTKKQVEMMVKSANSQGRIDINRIRSPKMKSEIEKLCS